MLRQLPAALAAAVLLSGCSVMQSSEELVQSTTLQPTSSIPASDMIVEVSPPKYTQDGRKHTDVYFDLLAEAASNDVRSRKWSKSDDSQPARIAMIKRDHNKPASIAMVENNDSITDNNALADNIAVNTKPSLPATTPVQDTVFFEFGSNELNMNGRVLLDNFVAQLDNSDLVELTGYTCNIGSDDVNRYLSSNRAQTVKAYLMYRGIDESRIVTEGRGMENPAASNGDEETRMINRRVEMKVSP